MRFKNISMNVVLISTCELQTYLNIKEHVNAVKRRVHTRLPKPLLEILLGYGNYFREKLSERMLYHALLIGFSDYFIAAPEFHKFSAKLI